MRPFLHTIWFDFFIILPIAFAFLVWKFGARRSAEVGPVVRAAGTKLVDAADRIFSGGRRHDAWSTSRINASGNTAFDEWRAAELSRLERECGELEMKHREFTAFVESLRRAKDRETFDRFMNAFVNVRHPAG